MRLWTMQPFAVLELVQKTGCYRCDPALCSMPEYTLQYDWLTGRMTDMIGPPPSGVKYPVWAWYMQNGRSCKPDLRRERWGYGPGDEQYTCIELEVPDNEVVLSDFEDWNIILNNGLISYSEAEYDEMEMYYEALPEEKKQTYMLKNWERVFDITPCRSEWADRGFWVQATFWEMRSEYIKDVRYFKTARHEV